MPKLITELDEATWQALQQRAQQHGHTPEEEAAAIARSVSLANREAMVQHL